MLVGGYHGAWLPADQAPGLTLSNAALRPLGAFTGAGVLAALPAGLCGLAETGPGGPVPGAGVGRAVRPVPERPALDRGGHGRAGRAAGAAGPRVLADLSRWAGLVEGRGACHHPDGTVRFLRSALRVFAGEVRQHRQGRCSAASDRPFLPVPAGPPTDADWS